MNSKKIKQKKETKNCKKKKKSFSSLLACCVLFYNFINCIKIIYLLLGDFTLYFTPFGACIYILKQIKLCSKKHACLKGAFHRSLTVLVRYRFPLQYYINN